MKIALSVFTTVVLFGLLLLYSPFSPDLGLRFGYFGELNEILNEVERVEKLEVQKVTQHRDFTLEDFSIYLRTESGRNCSIDIYDFASVRDSSDHAKGVMIFGARYRKVQIFRFSDSPIWNEIGRPKSNNIRGLLPILDRFLGCVDSSTQNFVDLEWEEKNDFICIRYKNRGEHVALLNSEKPGASRN